MTRPSDFLSRSPTPGHAMIAVSTAGEGEEAWGFYPGGIKNELLVGGWERYNRSSVIPINDIQYNLLKSEIEKWRNKGYILTLRDCTDFVLDVLKAAKIPTPEDSLWPSNLGEDMEALHGKNAGRCLAARPPVTEWVFKNIQQDKPVPKSCSVVWPVTWLLG